MWRAAMSTRTTRHGSGDVNGRRRPPPDGSHLEDDEVGVTDLHARDYADIVKRSAKRAVDDQLPDAAAAIAYYSFLAMIMNVARTPAPADTQGVAPLAKFPS